MNLHPYPERLYRLAALVLTAAYVAMFSYGYWLNADDIMFLQFSMEGFRSSIDNAYLYATAQGRIGQLFQMPLNILASHFFANPIARYLYLSAFFFSFYLLFVFFDKISKSQIGKISYIVSCALCAVHFYHLPPNSFPLQNTIPFIILTIIRIYIYDVRNEKNVRGTILVILSCLYAGAMLASEYSFLFGTGLIACEHASYLIRAPKIYFRSHIRPFLSDLISVFLSLIPYIIWRSLHPSQYDGNAIDGLGNLGTALNVWMNHTLGLLTMPLEHGASLEQISSASVVGIASIGILVAIGLGTASHKTRFTAGSLVFGLVFIAFAFYMTFPASMTSKQQQWCTELGACLFLDSRAAFPILIYGIVSIVAASLALIPLAHKLRTAVGVTLIGAVAFLAMATTHHNLWINSFMQTRMAVWEQANSVACQRTYTTADAQAIADPTKQIDIHPHLDPNHFWYLYLEDAGQNCN